MIKKIELTEFSGESALKITAEIQNKTRLLAEISGDLSIIDFPEISPIPARKNGLWTIGCFEMFISKNGNSYTEYNFGFDENWECFEFSDYRTAKPQALEIVEPKITCKTENDKFTQIVEFQKDIISKNFFSITAAIKLKNGDFLYFANKHCGQNPDFHLKSARSLKLL